MASHVTTTLANLQTAINACDSGTAGEYSTIEITTSGTLSAVVQFPATLHHVHVYPATGVSAILTSGVNVLELLHSGSDDAHDIIVEGVTLKHTPAGANATLAKVNGVNASLLLDSCHVWGAGTAGAIFAPSAAGKHVATMALDACTFEGAFAYLGYGSAGMDDVRATDCDMRAVTGMEYVLYGNAWGYEFTRCRFVAGGLHEGLNAFSPVVSKSNLYACEFRATAPNVIANFATFTGASIDWRKSLLVGYATKTGTGVYLQSGVSPGEFNPVGCGFVNFATAINTVNNHEAIRCGFYDNTAIKAGTGTLTQTSCQTTDPTFTDFANHDYTIPGTSPWFDTAGDTGLSTDLSGYSLPQGEADDIGPWEREVIPPDVVGATLEGGGTIRVDFSEAVEGADIEDAAAWSVTDSDGGAVALIAAVQTGDAVVRLNVTGLNPGTTYTVTAPASITDLEGTPIDDRTASFTTEAAAIVVYTPPSFRVTFDGAAVEALSLLPDDGEPEAFQILRALWLSLWCRARAGEGDPLPDPNADPADVGGWWGNAHPTVPGDEWGSKWWMLLRYRGTDAAAKAVDWGRKALAWAVTDGLLDADPVLTATRDGERLDVTIRVVINGRPAELLFDLWGGA